MQLFRRAMEFIKFLGSTYFSPNEDHGRCELICLFGLMTIGPMLLGGLLIYWAFFGDTTYHVRAGMPGGGFEGTRDAAVALFIVGLVAFGIGAFVTTVLLFSAIADFREEREKERERDKNGE